MTITIYIWSTSGRDNVMAETHCGFVGIAGMEPVVPTLVSAKFKCRDRVPARRPPAAVGSRLSPLLATVDVRRGRRR